MPNKNEDLQKELLALMQNVIEQEKALREKYQMGEKFRFIRDRLEALRINLEQNLISLEKKSEVKKDQVAEDEMLAFVYVFNAQGLLLQSWQKMLNPSVFYDYSVNRPIYSDKSSVEAFIRSKKNKVQHGYLTIVVKKSDLISNLPALTDAINNPLIRVKEGSLHADRLVSFTHNGVDYLLNEEGHLIKKIQP